MKRMIIVVVLWVVAVSARAQDVATSPPDEDWNALRGRAAEMHEKVKGMRAEAERRHVETEKACRGKFLAASCIEDAGKARHEAEREAKRVEREARDIERRIKAHEREVKEARRLEEAPRREAEAARRAEKNRREQEEAMRRAERKQAEDEARPRGRK